MNRKDRAQDLGVAEKSSSQPVFNIPFLPTGVPLELQALAEQTPLAAVRYAIGWGAGSQYGGEATAADLAKYVQEIVSRQAQGWLRVTEAAQLLQDDGRGSATGRAGWVAKLSAAAERGDLQLYDKGTGDRIECERGERRAYQSDLVRRIDLDRWIEADRPALPFRFCAATPARSYDLRALEAERSDPVLMAPTEQAPLSVRDSAKRDHRSHRISRRDLLGPVIDIALKAVSGPADKAGVMVELERLARLPDGTRPAPLAGVTSGGIQWHNGGQVKVLTRKALGDRLRRREEALEAALSRVEARA